MFLFSAVDVAFSGKRLFKCENVYKSLLWPAINSEFVVAGMSAIN
jgi:hypothetical protein